MLTKKDIVKAFKDAGLPKGAVMMLHSSYISLGEVEGGPEAVLDALQEALGPKGTLVLPVFAKLGVLTELVKQRPGAVISPCPLGTVCAVGPKAKEIVKDHWKADTVHGWNTPFGWMAKNGAYICLLGCDEDRNTFLHFIEAVNKLPYLRDATAEVEVGGKKIKKTWKYYPGPHRDFIGLECLLREANAITQFQLGNAQVRLMRADRIYEVLQDEFEADPAAALCDNPECADCVMQRAKLFEAKASRLLPGILTASSRLAGRYVPEMIENLKAAGIKYVELDYVQGRAAANMKGSELADVVAELSRGGIAVSALRVPFISDEPQAIVDKAKEAKIGMVILPAYPYEAIKMPKGMKLLFANGVQTAVSAANAFAAYKKAFGFAFNPANFAAAGEMPFLKSYKAGRFIKTMVQLDIVDAKFNGEETELACGNAEVKEMLSIMRCNGFPAVKGQCVISLGGGAKYPGTLREAASDLEYLLDNM